MWTFRANSPSGRRSRTVCLVLLALLACQASQLAGMPRAERHENRHEIDDLEEAWRVAVIHRNVQAIAAMLADDYLAIMPSGTLFSKEQTLANMRSGAMHFNSIQYADRKVRFYSSTAVVTSRAYVNGATPEGPLVGIYRFTRVYVRDDGGAWKIVSFEASRVRSRPKKP